MTCIDITEIKTALQEVYTIEEIDEWLDSKQALLAGRTPTKAIADGDYDYVLLLARQLADSVHI